MNGIDKKIDILESKIDKITELMEKWGNVKITRLDRIVFLHKELMKLTTKKVHKDYVYTVLSNKYKMTNTSITKIWIILPNLDNTFNVTKNKKRAFKITHESNLAYIESLDAVYPEDNY